MEREAVVCVETDLLDDIVALIGAGIIENGFVGVAENGFVGIVRVEVGFLKVRCALARRGSWMHVSGPEPWTSSWLLGPNYFPMRNYAS